MIASPSTDRTAWGWGLATVHDAAGVLDTYYPTPAPRQPGREGRGADRAGRGPAERRDAFRAHRGAVHRDRPGHPAGQHAGRVPAAAPAQPPAGRAAHDQPGRNLRRVCPTWSGPRWAPARSTGSSPSGPGSRPGTATVTVYGVDKFPRMVDYVLPSGVRIADADRVRLGAHLAAGTTVMHEGFVNFNAGTLGSLDGRGPDLLRRGGRPRLRRRWRRLDHGHAVRRRSAGDLDRRALPARRERRDRHRTRRRLRGRGRAVRHRGHQGHAAGRRRGQGPHPVRGERAAVSSATR